MESVRCETLDKTQIEDVFDVIIIGAGPCGLAIAARLGENTPAALFTDEEHRRYQWLRDHGPKVALKRLGSGRPIRTVCTKDSRPEYRMAVIDATADRWMARWDARFEALHISHLRSPLLWHLDPKDADSLLAFAHQGGRSHELVEIRGCVGKEISKHARKKRQSGRRTRVGPNQNAEINERERNDYFTPSREMFHDHCSFVSKEYQLNDGLVHHETAVDISYGPTRFSANGESLFTVTTDICRRHARVVVLALGPSHKLQVPFETFELPTESPQFHESKQPPQTCHSSQIKEIPDKLVSNRIAAGLRTNVLVVGGGLTSAQIADLVIRRGVSKVYNITRGPCRVKPFDVNLEWMSKYRNPRLAEFWSADSDEDRLELIREARGGGSMTPIFHKKLARHETAGRLSRHTFTTLKSARFVVASGACPPGNRFCGYWEVETEPPIAGGVGLPPMDYIYFATGAPPDLGSFPCLRTMAAQHPIRCHGGLPCLNDRLMWADDVPLFVTGALAGLRIGPGAGNLGGAKIAAERVALEIEDMDIGDENGDDELEQQESCSFKYLMGLGSKFSSLSADA